MQKILLLLTTLLLFTCLSASAPRPSLQSDEDINYWVKVDTAYTEEVGYVINRADSMKVNGHSFVGPGPISITFFAELTKQPTYCSWELATDNRFEDLLDQFRVLDGSGTVSQFDYEFSEAGTYYVRFVADFAVDGASSDQPLSYTTEVPYQIQITESLLEVPNVITPDKPESKNSVFRVKYKSLVSYEIWIHNRWGQELFHSTNPEDGWDGTSGGSIVPTGAYYYLIKAEGTEGMRYNKKGAINVLRTKDKTSF